MRKFKIVSIFTMVVLMAFVNTACASKGVKNDMAKSSYDAIQYENGYEGATEVRDEAKTEEASDNGLISTSGLIGNTENLSMDKIITTVDLEVETEDFDNLISTIKDEIIRLGGYDEKTEISGRRYYSRSSSRYGYIVARIPKERLKEFVSAVKENGNVYNETSSSENVTLQYVDTESRKKSLEIEQERLFGLLEKTETLEDIVSLESRLSSIRHELQMLETELRTIDNKVDYSTVTIHISEVERLTPTTEEKETVFTRIKVGFSDTIYDISEGLKDFIVWFVVNLPYLIIWALIIALGVVVSRKFYKKIKGKKIPAKLPTEQAGVKINKEESDK